MHVTGNARRPLILAAMAILTVVPLAACGTDETSTPDVPTVTPATASPAPATPTAAPAGFVVGAPSNGRALALSGETVAVLDEAGTGVSRFVKPTSAESTGAQPVVGTPELSALVGDGNGGFVGAGPGTLVRIDAAGQVQSTDTEVAEPTALARTASGHVVVGGSDGTVSVYDSDLALERTITGFVGIDDITVSPEGADLPAEQVVVLDRAQSSVTPITLSDGKKGPALRAGNGATTSAVDDFGRVLVANTRDGEIIGFFGSPLVMRFRYPVAGGPYAVDYDDRNDLLWVSTTADNEVVGFDIADGEPAEKQRFATVSQPDSMVVDDETGTVYVLSARDGGLQVVNPVSPR